MHRTYVQAIHTAYGSHAQNTQTGNMHRTHMQDTHTQNKHTGRTQNKHTEHTHTHTHKTYIRDIYAHLLHFSVTRKGPG